MISKKKLFVTLFPDFQEIHMHKDVGQIPLAIAQLPNYRAQIVSYQNETIEINLNTNEQGFEIKFLKKPAFKLHFYARIIKYLIHNSCKIDILNIYHLSWKSFLFGLIYKVTNKSGILYLKTDLDIKSFVSYQPLNADRSILYLLFYRIFKIFFHIVVIKYLFRFADVISAETVNGCYALKERFTVASTKIIYLPNGIDFSMEEISNKYLPQSCSKENLIITVGRLGTEQKNTEMFLSALEKINLTGWKVVLIGSIEEKFTTYINAYYKRNPHLQKIINFVGPISNRYELANWYSKAKVFCLSSRWESFGLVLIEALFWKNYLITTNISSANDITNDSKFGKIVNSNDSIEFALAIKEAMSSIDQKIKIQNEAQSFVLNHFSWKSIVNNFAMHIEKNLIYKKTVVE